MKPPGLLYLLCQTMIAALLLLPATATPARTLTDPLHIDSGLISGTSVGTIHIYKGIPYAAPPVETLRWKPPLPVAPWKSVRACSSFGPACPQPEALFGTVTERQSEDCLYLNVWTPAATATARLPVMVWIHGGGYTTGAGSSILYDGMYLAGRGIVLVTINYRLGPFGYLAHPLLSRESAQHVSGNYGLLDQIAALHWVRRNIATFGGNPDNVSIFGESAGAGSVCYLMYSPLAKGLFQRAIAESGSVVGYERHLRDIAHGEESMESTGTRLAHQLHCDTARDPLDALRAVTAAGILQAANPAQGLFGKGVKFGPIVDGQVLPDDPVNLLAAGKFAHVPFLSGTNANEGTIFLRQLPILHVAGYRLLMRRIFRTEAEKALALYPANTDEDVPAALDKMITAGFASACRYLARAASREGCATFVYQFKRQASLPNARALGAFHSQEIFYVFDNLPLQCEERDRRLAGEMSACWVRFAATGNPNGPGLPSWPIFEKTTDRYLVFGDETVTAHGILRSECDLFDCVRDVRTQASFRLD